MLYSSAIDRLKISTEEYVNNVEDIPETPMEIKAYIPKLMPQIQMGEEANASIKLYINRGVFANASDCSVMQTPTVINGQNFVTLKPFGNERPNFRKKAVLKDGAYIVEKHSQFIASVLHGDILNMYITSKT